MRQTLDAVTHLRRLLLSRLCLLHASCWCCQACRLSHRQGARHRLLQVPPAGGAAATCVAVRFDAFTARLGGLPEAAVSLGWLRPLGYVDTLYLDEELRVSVGDKGGLFVLRRVAGHGAGAEAAAAPEPPAAAGR